MGGWNGRELERENKRETEKEEEKEGERRGRRKVNIYTYIDMRRVYVCSIWRAVHKDDV